MWTTVCSSKDLKPNSLKAAFGAGQDILIATDKGGKVFAAANVCPHIGTPLDQGTVENNAIVCPLHRSAFDLRSGKLEGPWCPAPPLIGPLTGKLKSPRELQTFQARNQGGKVQVRERAAEAAHTRTQAAAQQHSPRFLFFPLCLSLCG